MQWVGPTITDPALEPAHAERVAGLVAIGRVRLSLALKLEVDGQAGEAGSERETGRDTLDNLKRMLKT